MTKTYKTITEPPPTKRELFAAMAMQGLLAGEQKNNLSILIAEKSVVCADALLAELEKK